MTRARFHNWDETEIPKVSAEDLAAAIAPWLARERAGMVLVGTPGIASREQIEADVIGMHESPATGLSVLLRMRCLVEALSLRRFRHLVKAENAATLGLLVEAVATQRLNPRWGISPVRLAWATASNAAVASDRKAA